MCLPYTLSHFTPPLTPHASQVDPRVVSCHVLEWGGTVVLPDSMPHPDVLLGSDLLYDPGAVQCTAMMCVLPNHLPFLWGSVWGHMPEQRAMEEED